MLRIADNVDPSSLNPLLAHDQDTIGYDLLVTETLVGLSADNRLVPVLLTRVPTRANGDVSSDGKTIVYHLKPGVRFADGTPLSSRDVAFTFRAILDLRNPVESEDAYRRVASLKTPDAHTVVVRLKKRWNAAVAQLFAQADFAFGILPAHAFTSTDVTRADWNQRPFGTGPFRVVEWERANRIVLEPNPYYKPAPKLRRIVFSLIPTTQAALIAVRSGDVDVALLDPAQLREARGMSGAHILKTSVNGLYLLTLRVTNPPTDDLAVRHAIDAAIDRDAIVRGRYGALTPADSFLPPVFAWHDPGPTAARPAGVTRELTGDGWHRDGQWWTKNGSRLSVTIDFQATQGSWMEVMEQEQLRRAGIDASLKPFVTAEFNSPSGPLRSGRFTLAASQWIGAADPEQSVIFACSQRGSNGNNDSDYCSPQFEALFEDQATTPSERQRATDYVAMQRTVRRDVPIVPIAFETRIDAVANRVSGFRRNMLMYPVDPQSWDTR
ncbi:MAG TPA: peptide ABC transporter substrate-binding protein [Candidatus Baltobacteraceae bacterium]|nr:peptide ABC transporter substrate-binding protein [Candidatus Baltobacteraceae bacterium]